MKVLIIGNNKNIKKKISLLDFDLVIRININWYLWENYNFIKQNIKKNHIIYQIFYQILIFVLLIFYPFYMVCQKKNCKIL